MELPKLFHHLQSQDKISPQFQTIEGEGVIYSSGEECRDFIDLASYLSDLASGLSERLDSGNLQRIQLFGEEQDASVVHSRFKKSGEKFSIGLVADRVVDLEDIGNRFLDEC